ncbi:carboxymuconolactone decarboxylase family protein [Streptosporangium sp. CA-135522]|uniref:carboxymuconolactone decarboxylase family protein n=1 Tax=Streptosporangium sp. CA-135522 TaxID=3240072 RepID=UPI003D8F70FF
MDNLLTSICLVDASRRAQSWLCEDKRTTRRRSQEMTNTIDFPVHTDVAEKLTDILSPGVVPCDAECADRAGSDQLNHEGSTTPYIALNSDEPGIRGLFKYRPETAFPLNGLVEVLLFRENSLTRGERELIATYVSALNECRFCFFTHAAIAAAHLPEGMTLVEQVRADLEAAPVSDKLRALLAIAAAVQQSGRRVSRQDIAAARAAGATDLEIHDTVLIAAAFCMYNRYVDGLGTLAANDPEHYAARAERTDGYLAVLADSLSQG